MMMWRAIAAFVLAFGVVVGVTAPGEAATKQLPAPKIVSASSSATDAVTVSFSTVAGASSYTLFVYGATGQAAQSYPAATPAGTTVSGLSVCTTYRVAVQAISSSRTVQSSVQSGKTSVTTKCNAALVPTFGTPTATADGFTVQITNFDASFAWSGSVTAGSAAIDGSGLATVSGLTTDASQTLTVTTTRATYDTGSATIAAARSTTPAVPSYWIGSGDFTVDLWVKPTEDWSNPLRRQELFAITPSSIQGRMDIAYMETGNWEVISHQWSSPPVSGPMAPPPVGTWTHVALTRQSGTMRLYVGGQKVAESSATQDFSTYTELFLGADVNSGSCHCNLARALLSNVRVTDGTALYTGSSLTIPASPLTAVAGTTFLLNNALNDSTVGSVQVDGTMRYQQGISTVTNPPVLSPFTGYQWDGGNWQTVPVVTSADSPFNICGSNGLRAPGVLCKVGDVTAAGGTIFYVSATAFTSTGSPCNTSCHYLEVAPIGWAPLTRIPDNTTDPAQLISRSDANVDPYLMWWSRAWGDLPPVGMAPDTGIGFGMSNTQDIRTKALALNSSQPLSSPARFAFQAALEYPGGGGTSTVGEWFLPSMGEENELCKYATGQTADLGNLSAGCTGPATGPHVPVLGLSAQVYWSSSYPYMEGTPYPYTGTLSPTQGQTPGYIMSKPYAGNYYSGYYSVYGNYVRPVRAS